MLVADDNNTALHTDRSQPLAGKAGNLSEDDGKVKLRLTASGVRSCRRLKLTAF
jgi:hypothetical protein